METYPATSVVVKVLDASKRGVTLQVRSADSGVAQTMFVRTGETLDIDYKFHLEFDRVVGGSR